VVSEKPAPGTALAEGRTVALTVSLGNTLTTPPQLTSAMDEAAVDATLEAADLRRGTTTSQYDENVAQGFLVSWSPQVTADSGGQIPKRTKIDVVLSDGPEPRTVPPGLVGQPIDAVTQQLAQLKLGVNVTEQFSDEAIGTVLSVAQAEGTQVPRDSALDIVTSKGPELFAVPDVRGRSGLDASKVLRDGGFVVAGITGSPFAPVVGLAPTPGQMVPRGTPVQLLTNG
jgi:serine/threonine-protein kinase